MICNTGQQTHAIGMRRYTTHAMESFWIRAVDSRYKVSLGGSLWNTTLDIEDFPLLVPRSASATPPSAYASESDSPSLTHQEESGLAFGRRAPAQWFRFSGPILLLLALPILFKQTFEI